MGSFAPTEGQGAVTRLIPGETMKKLFTLTLLLIVLLPGGAALADELVPEDTLILFWGEGCPYCMAEKQWLETIADQYPDLEIATYEVYNSRDNQTLMAETLAAFGMSPSVVPVTVYQGRVWEGFSDGVATEIEAMVAAAADSGDDTPDIPGPDPDASRPSEVFRLPLIGEVDVGNSSLVVASLVIGFVDGFNPCSLWALSVLLALVLRSGSRGRVLLVGSTFLLVTASLYGLYIFGMYSALDFVAHAQWVRILMAFVALTFGLINVKDFFWFRQGPSLTISDKAKPGLYQRMRGIAFDGKSLPAVLGGTVVLAVGVSLLELPCTAGYPLLWANLVSRQEVAFGAAFALFLIYMVVYLLDEFAIFGAAVVTMRVTKMEEKQGQWLKLASGMLMVVLAGVLLFAPHLMESISGALITFGVAVVATLLVALIKPVRAKLRG